MMAWKLWKDISELELWDFRQAVMRMTGRYGLDSASVLEALRQHLKADRIDVYLLPHTNGNRFTWTWNQEPSPELKAWIQQQFMGLQVELEAPVGHALPMNAGMVEE